MSRRQAREVAFRSLFQVDIGKGEPAVSLQYNIVELGLDPTEAAYANFLVEGVLAHMPELDAQIRTLSPDRTVERLVGTDRAILRMAIYELLHGPADSPAGVVINEAVSLAKAYSEESSGRFVNGVLGNIARSLSAPAGSSDV